MERSALQLGCSPRCLIFLPTLPTDCLSGGHSLWVFATDRLSDTEIWRLWLAWALTSGILTGILLSLCQKLLPPLRQFRWHRACAGS
jgi:hypothetical protein